MTVLRPMCAVCFREPREPNSGRCWDCGPGRIKKIPKVRTPADVAARALGVDEDSSGR